MMPSRRNMLLCAGAVGLLATLSACFGLINDPVRHYYTLHLEPLQELNTRHVKGLVRVRDLDAESAYDRFQIVLRRSPFELVYRHRDVWAVKPNRMISDIIARGLMSQNVFSAVTRELSERRPQYLLSGELHAIEVYDSGNTWFAHLDLSLQISHFASGQILWTFNFDDRKEVPSQEFPICVRALSELVSDAIESAMVSMRTMRSVNDIEGENIHDQENEGASPAAEPIQDKRPPATPVKPSTLPDEPVMVPEPLPK